jgi:hypothetical protein
MAPEPWSDISLFAFVARHRDVPLVYGNPDRWEEKKSKYLRGVRLVLDYAEDDVCAKTKGVEKGHYL